MRREAYEELHNVEDHHWWFVARRTILKKTLDRYAVRPCSILEVGCGSGGNLELLSTYGTIHALEMDDEARRNANHRAICTVIPGSLPGPIPFTTNFDIICLLDVLEHIEDDRDALKSVVKKLKERGKLILMVPAYPFLWSAHDEACHHQRRYTRKRLAQRVQEAGLTIRYATYFNTFLFPAIALVRFAKKLRRTAKTDMSMPPGSINTLLKHIFSGETFLIPGRSLPFGVSILVVAENSPKR